MNLLEIPQFVRGFPSWPPFQGSVSSVCGACEPQKLCCCSSLRRSPCPCQCPPYDKLISGGCGGQSAHAVTLAPSPGAPATFLVQPRPPQPHLQAPDLFHLALFILLLPTPGPTRPRVHISHLCRILFSKENRDPQVIRDFLGKGTVSVWRCCHVGL